MAAARQGLKALLTCQLAHDLDDEVAIGRLAHQLAPVISPVGEQVLQPSTAEPSIRPRRDQGCQAALKGPTLANRDDDGLGTGGILHIGRGEVDHQEPPVGVDGDVALAAIDGNAIDPAREAEPAHTSGPVGSRLAAS